jgi:hypothetical protein
VVAAVIVVSAYPVLVRAIDGEMIEAQLHHFAKQTVLRFRSSRRWRQGWPALSYVSGPCFLQSSAELHIFNELSPKTRPKVFQGLQVRAKEPP